MEEYQIYVPREGIYADLKELEVERDYSNLVKLCIALFVEHKLSYIPKKFNIEDSETWYLVFQSSMKGKRFEDFVGYWNFVKSELDKRYREEYVEEFNRKLKKVNQNFQNPLTCDFFPSHLLSKETKSGITEFITNCFRSPHLNYL